VTLGADKGYDAEDFVMERRQRSVRAHVAQSPLAFAAAAYSLVRPPRLLAGAFPANGLRQPMRQDPDSRPSVAGFNGEARRLPRALVLSYRRASAVAGE
jgi:hypothetical protein